MIIGSTIADVSRRRDFPEFAPKDVPAKLMELSYDATSVKIYQWKRSIYTPHARLVHEKYTTRSGSTWKYTFYWAYESMEGRTTMPCVCKLALRFRRGESKCRKYPNNYCRGILNFPRKIFLKLFCDGIEPPDFDDVIQKGK